MFRFIHAADIHLDSPLRGLERYPGAPVEEIRGATRRALENLVDLALERKADFVLIAGDLYDGDWKDHHTGLFFVAQMSRLRELGIPVVLIRGNHDAENRMTRSLRLPDNVELLPHARAATAQLPRLRELGVAVHGRSFAQAAELGNLVPDYPAADRALFNIGILHTSLAGAEGHAAYAPCSLDDLRQKQYDYWALGHVHTREVKCPDPYVVFSGNIQGRHIREPGSKGCYLVSVGDRGQVELEFQPLDVFRWAICEVALNEARQTEDVLESFARRLRALAAEHAGLPLGVRAVVTGPTPLDAQLRAAPAAWALRFREVAVEAAGDSVWLEKVALQTVAPRQAAAQPPGAGALSALRECLEALQGDVAQLTQLSAEFSDLRRKLPEELVRGEDALGLDDPAMLRQWLEEIQPLVLGRLTEKQDW